MIKGCQKRMIHLQGVKSDYFDEAFFVLKRGEDFENASEENIIKEALRIAEKALSQITVKKNASRKKAFQLIFAGASLLSFIFGIAMLLITALCR